MSTPTRESRLHFLDHLFFLHNDIASNFFPNAYEVVIVDL